MKSCRFNLLGNIYSIASNSAMVYIVSGFHNDDKEEETTVESATPNIIENQKMS